MPRLRKLFRLPDPPQDLQLKLTCNHGDKAATNRFWLGYFVAILRRLVNYQRAVRPHHRYLKITLYYSHSTFNKSNQFS